MKLARDAVTINVTGTVVIAHLIDDIRVLVL